MLALESARAGAFVVGEDLGTVEDAVRAALADRGILVVPGGVVRGRAARARGRGDVARRGDHPRPAHRRRRGDRSRRPRLRAKLESIVGRPITASDDPVAVAAETYRHLAASPCQLVAAVLEDAIGVAERPNVPGTTDEHPNWRLALPRPLEEIESDPGAIAVAAALRRD